jgi:hypothetical protein
LLSWDKPRIVPGDPFRRRRLIVCRAQEFYVIGFPFAERLDGAEFHAAEHEGASSIFGEIIVQFLVGMLPLGQLVEVFFPPADQVDRLSDVQVFGDRVFDFLNAAHLHRHLSPFILLTGRPT